MKIKTWYKSRGLKFIWKRGSSLLERYGLLSGRAINRIKDCIAELEALGCSPTFPTPGMVIKQYPQFFRSLQKAGVEIAVHGYHHINLRDLSVTDAVQQLMRAVETFERFGIEVHGFRCPYTGHSYELLDALPRGVFGYSSDQTIYWDVLQDLSNQKRSLFFDTLKRFYDAIDSSSKICVPWMRSNLVEIPVCVPDDLQLYDGLECDSAMIANIWKSVLHQTNLRGELYTLLFHTELASICIDPFRSLLQQAQRYQPKVWIARLQDISDWWCEKSNFKIDIASTATGLRLNFICTSRATILIRGIDNITSAPIWDNVYHRLHSNVLEVSTNTRPFIGLAVDVPKTTISFLQNQGYILDASPNARTCGIFFDHELLSKLKSEVELVDYIETSPAPLVRFWRWPDGAKSALCITGDLDAITLFDYASRLFIA